MTEKSDYTRASDRLIEIQKLCAQATADFHLGYTKEALVKLEKVKKLSAATITFIKGHSEEREKKTEKFLKTIRKTKKANNHGRAHKRTKAAGKKKS